MGGILVLCRARCGGASVDEDLGGLDRCINAVKEGCSGRYPPDDAEVAEKIVSMIKEKAKAWTIRPNQFS